MSSDRRSFLRNIALGSGALAAGVPSLNGLLANGHPQEADTFELKLPAPGNHNMCGYAAPKLEKVRIGFIGLGMRGPGAVQRMSHIEGV